MKKTKIFLVLIAVGLILAVAGKMISKNTDAKRTTEAVVYSVSTAPVEIGKIVGILNYTGNVEGINEATIVTKTAGIVEKVLFKPGQRVSAGQTLIVLENALQRAAVEQAKAQLMAAQTSYEKSLADLKRIETLLKDEVATKDNLELAQLNVKAQLAGVKGAEANLQLTQRQLEDCFVKATISGNAATKDIVEGTLAAPGMKVTHIVDFSRFKLMINVNENDISKLSQGQETNLQIDAVQDMSYIGKINSIGMYSGDGMRSYPVEIIIDKGEKSLLKSGMFARCQIKSETKDNAMIVPESAVILNNDGTAQLFVIENGKSYLRKIKPGIKSNGKIEIVSGIDQNMKIVSTGKERLLNGMVVKEK